jgi:hypothetical protein
MESRLIVQSVSMWGSIFKKKYIFSATSFFTLFQLENPLIIYISVL